MRLKEINGKLHYKHRIYIKREDGSVTITDKWSDWKSFEKKPKLRLVKDGEENDV